MFFLKSFFCYPLLVQHWPVLVYHVPLEVTGCSGSKVTLTTFVWLFSSVFAHVSSEVSSCCARIIEDYDRMIRIILLTTISCTISCPSFLPQFSIQCEKYSRQELWKHWLGDRLWMQVIACYE